MSSEIREATILFLVDRIGHKDDRILLAMKKKGFGKGKWNGVGGKVEEKETIEEAALRETKEEIKVDVKDLEKKALLHFTFQNNPEWDQDVYVFITNDWEGDPTETDEMKPKWFDIEKIPYDQMWVDDELWLPKVLQGETLEAEFNFSDADKLIYWEIY